MTEIGCSRMGYQYRAQICYKAVKTEENWKVNGVLTKHRYFPTLKGAKGWLDRESKRMKGVLGLEIERIVESWEFAQD